MKSFATKVEKFSQNITPFGGISYVNIQFNNCGLAQLIDNELGIRGNGTGYSHSEIFRNWFDLIFCGGECAEDIQVHLRSTLEQIPDNKVASADTMLREVKSLAVDNTEVVSTSEKVYQFNINKKMNERLLSLRSLSLSKCRNIEYEVIIADRST